MPMKPDAQNGAQTPDAEGPMFAPTPIWAQDPKARRRARTTSTRRRVDDIQAGPALSDPAQSDPTTGATTAAEPAPARRGGVSPTAIAAGVAVAAVLAGAGWYAASRPNDHGLAQLTPGGPAPGQSAVNAATPPNAGQLPITRVSDSSTTTTTTEQTPPAKTEPAPRPHRGSRARPASAMDSSLNASATASSPDSAPAPEPTSPHTTPNLTPLAGTTSPVPPASTPSASSASPGASPAATPGGMTTP